MASADVTRRVICVVTTTRADYGLLCWLMKEIAADPELELRTIATGTHLSPDFGMTVEGIEADGLRVDRRIEMLLSSDSEAGIVKSLGVEMLALADALRDLAPAVVVVLGDRSEIVPVALAAVVFGIPVAHIHGGECSEGAIDEFFRHAVTKLASVHFAATETYRKRILQMGENPDLTFNCGAPGLDAIYKLPLISRKELGESLHFDLSGTVAIVTYHPVTTEPGRALEQVDGLLTAIESSGIRAIFTKANADLGGGGINRRVAEFCQAVSGRFKLVDSLGQTRYLSCLRNLDLMVGNSSSGLIEAPSFALPVVNVGNRQKGRLRSRNVIDVGNGAEEIMEGIAKARSSEFRRTLERMENPYDMWRDGMTSHRIKEILKKVTASRDLIRKQFVNLVCELSDDS